MNRREERYTAYIGIMIGLCVGLVMIACAGCTTYDVSQTRNADGSGSTTVHVRSWRDFEEPALKYNRDGEAVGFEFGAKSAVGQSPLQDAAQLISIGAQLATGGVVKPPSTENENE